MKKEVFIDSKKRLVVVNGKKVPRLLLSIIQGAIGKRFVVKHYKGRKIVITRFPDMSGIVASEQQRVRRDLFREAVVYAKWIIADKERKKAFRKSLPRRKQRKVYQAVIQLYMSRQGDKQWLRKQLAVKSMVRAQRMDMVFKEVGVLGTEGVVMRVQEGVGHTHWTMGKEQGVMNNSQGTGKCFGSEGVRGHVYRQQGPEKAVQQKRYDWCLKKFDGKLLIDRYSQL